jgi:protein subunit release factor A
MDERILKGIIYKAWPEIPKGGQSVGLMRHGITLYHEELGIEISIDHERSQLKNRAIAMRLFEIYVANINFKS